MISHLRNIRRHFLKSSKVWNYVFYAIGEIGLVVIGILIALQVNNWNAKNKAKENELYLLTELESNLAEEATQISEMIDRREKAKNAIERMITYLPGQDFVVDSFEMHIAQMMTFERYFPIRNAYEISKTSGLQITNKNLRSQIARYYEFEQNKVQRSIEDIERMFINKFEPILSSTKMITGKYGVFIQFSTINDQSFIKEIYELAYGFRYNHLDSYEKIKVFKRKNVQLLNAVQNELNLF